MFITYISTWHSLSAQYLLVRDEKNKRINGLAVYAIFSWICCYLLWKHPNRVNRFGKRFHKAKWLRQGYITKCASWEWNSNLQTFNLDHTVFCLWWREWVLNFLRVERQYYWVVMCGFQCQTWLGILAPPQTSCMALYVEKRSTSLRLTTHICKIRTISSIILNYYEH